MQQQQQKQKQQPNFWMLKGKKKEVADAAVCLYVWMFVCMCAGVIARDAAPADAAAAAATTLGCCFGRNVTARDDDISQEEKGEEGTAIAS